MKRKSILTLILAVIVIVSISLVACGKYSSKTKTGNNFANSTEENSAITQDDIKNNADSIRDNAATAGDSLNYTALNFRDDVINAGYNLKDSVNGKRDYFKGSETDYLMGNDVVRVYEYNSAADLEGDINRIAPNGLTINGTNANYARRPNYYRKGNSLIMYEGNEPAYVDEFKTMYGNTIIP